MFLARVKGIAIGTRAEKINAVAEEVTFKFLGYGKLR